MASNKTIQTTKKPSVKRRNKGVVSKKGTSKNKKSDLYKKPSKGQG